MIIVQMITVILASIVPYIGNIINILVSGALMCGIYIALLAQRRGENVPFPLMFEGFSRILQTTLITLISSLPWIVFGVVIYSFIPLPNITPNPENPTEIIDAIFNRAVIVPLVVTYSIFFLVSLVISLLLFFALPLIADRDTAIGETIKLSVAAALGNVGGLIALWIFEILLLLGGALVCGVGVLFVMPIIYAANIVAYQSVFPDSHSPINISPPRPENYGDNYGTPL